MQKHIIILTGLLISGAVFSQVGINTENPQGIFNIDGGKDNPATGSGHTPAQQLNDFTVLTNGNVGIGTTTPTQKLEIRTGGTSASPVAGFKLADGTQNYGYVLTSNAVGVGTWQVPDAVTQKLGIMVANTLNMPFVPHNGDYWVSTGSYITLPAGTWKIDITQLLGGYTDNGTHLTTDDFQWFRFSLTDMPEAATVDGNPLPGNLGSILTDDFLSIDPNNGNQVKGGNQYVSTNFDGPRTATPTRFAVANGYFFVQNTAQTTYYLIANPNGASSTKTGFYYRNVGSDTWNENRIIASAINLTN